MENKEKSIIHNQFSINYYNQLANSLCRDESRDNERYEKFKERFLEFKTISSIEEAKELAKKILPTALEHTQFTVGKGTCVVINKSDVFRISLDSDEEFICYDFQK